MDTKKPDISAGPVCQYCSMLTPTVTCVPCHCFFLAVGKRFFPTTIRVGHAPRNREFCEGTFPEREIGWHGGRSCPNGHSCPAVEATAKIDRCKVVRRGTCPPNRSVSFVRCYLKPVVLERAGSPGVGRCMCSFFHVENFLVKEKPRPVTAGAFPFV